MEATEWKSARNSRQMIEFAPPLGKIWFALLLNLTHGMVHSHDVYLMQTAVADRYTSSETENFLIFHTTTVYRSHMHQMHIKLLVL